MTRNQQQGPLAGSENMFGKLRGRFDEDMARAVTAAQIKKCVAILSSLPVEEVARICEAFNARFGPMGREIKLVDRTHA